MSKATVLGWKIVLPAARKGERAQDLSEIIPEYGQAAGRLLVLQDRYPTADLVTVTSELQVPDPEPEPEPRPSRSERRRRPY